MVRARGERAAAPESRDSGHVAARRQLDELFREHSAFVARLVLRLIGRDEEIDDIVQDVFVSLFRQLDAIRKPESVRSWLLITTTRVTRRRLRLRKFGFFLHPSARVDPESVEAQAAGEDWIALRTIHRVLSRVPVNSRMAWILKYLEQKDLEEVARTLDCSESTAKRWLARAQRSMKKALSR